MLPAFARIALAGQHLLQLHAYFLHGEGFHQKPLDTIKFSLLLVDQIAIPCAENDRVLRSDLQQFSR